jgi:hypothetical protein
MGPGTMTVQAADGSATADMYKAFNAASAMGLGGGLTLGSAMGPATVMTPIAAAGPAQQSNASTNSNSTSTPQIKTQASHHGQMTTTSTSAQRY